MSLVALRLTKRIARVDRLDRPGIEYTILQRAECGLADHVGDIESLA